jgi:cell division protein FtsI (penicillin-binding protein 3)
VRGYRVAGKTGTAYKVEGGRYVKKYVGSFVGLAPVSDPRIIIAVMIDEPSGPQHFGGQVAAPAFSNVAAGTLRLMNVAPDAPVTNVILPAAPITETM